MTDIRELRGKGLGKGPGGALGHAHKRDPNSNGSPGPLYLWDLCKKGRIVTHCFEKNSFREVVLLLEEENHTIL